MGRVIVTVAGVPTAETLPAASLAQGKKVWLPAAAAVTVAGAVAVHPAAPAAGGVADWVTMYPVTATLSVAVNALMLTVRLAAEAGMVNAVTAGAVVSGVEAVRLCLPLPGRHGRDIAGGVLGPGEEGLAARCGSGNGSRGGGRPSGGCGSRRRRRLGHHVSGHRHVVRCGERADAHGQAGCGRRQGKCRYGRGRGVGCRHRSATAAAASLQRSGKSYRDNYITPRFSTHICLPFDNMRTHV